MIKRLATSFNKSQQNLNSSMSIANNLIKYQSFAVK